MDTREQERAERAALLAAMKDTLGPHAGRTSLDAVEIDAPAVEVYGIATLALTDRVHFDFRVPATMAVQVAALVKDLIEQGRNADVSESEEPHVRS